MRIRSVQLRAAGRRILTRIQSLVTDIRPAWAWVGDDAFITMRTVDNFVHGYGLRFNVCERVQSYTNPLWMFLLSAGYWVTLEPFYTVIGISIVISVVAFCLLAQTTTRTDVAPVAIAMGLVFSRAFVDYSTSGLENPLSHLLAIVFLLVAVDPRRMVDEQRRILWAGLIAGLAMLNRLDAGLLYLPSLALLVWEHRDRRRAVIRQLAIGFAPLIAWEAFSLVYYGFLLPNTAYAKLNLQLPRHLLVRNGLNYFLDLAVRDPWSAILLTAGLVMALGNGSRQQRALSAGIVGYLAYVVWIGGDFMAAASCRRR